ncbi:hypothetical protein COL154_013814 [Colletotrichum chrysophilum]|nr:hypothetical protein KNSL1_013685 [Colletotrichum chrysophilum]KAJ0347857.1 hypothetical protein COL154_013814 [Colletotrichum chrysophilum]
MAVSRTLHTSSAPGLRHNQCFDRFPGESESEALPQVTDTYCAPMPNPTETKESSYNKSADVGKKTQFIMTIDKLIKAVQKRGDFERIADLKPSVMPESRQDLRQSQGDSTVTVTIWYSAEEAATPTKP